MDFGSGQSKCCNQGMVVVTTDSEAAIGESVTVTANLLDADGQILATVEQIESFNWIGQELASPSRPEIKAGEFSDYTASFAFTNETDADLENLRVGVVCYDAAQKIIGGTTTYLELAPANYTIRIDADPTVSGKPASCKAFVNYDV